MLLWKINKYVTVIMAGLIVKEFYIMSQEKNSWEYLDFTGDFDSYTKHTKTC